jgi:DNA-binding transcriptional regulator GbsR (MarR family)
MPSEEIAVRGIVVDDDPRDKEIEKLRLKLRQAERDTADAERAAERAREDAHRALSMLRKQLGPLYRALQAVFGELDAAGITDTPAAQPGAAPVPAGQDPRVTAVWQAWKEKFPPACGKVIDALLLHGELNSVQLKVTARLGTSSVSESISKLNKAGLINKNGGRFSLKSL